MTTSLASSRWRVAKDAHHILQLRLRQQCLVRTSTRHNSTTAAAAVAYTPPSIPAVDIHTHMYFPRYMDLLRSRNEIPKIIVTDATNEQRLVILPSEDTQHEIAANITRGRPIGSQYFDLQRKLAFMDTHNIDISVISLANPWLDFLGADESKKYARLLNEDLQEMSEMSMSSSSSVGGGQTRPRIYGFGVLPNTAGVAQCIAEVEYCAEHLPHIRGFIVGTHGTLGTGMDDKRLLDLYHCVADAQLTLFVHPHYGIGNEYYTGFGHILYLTLGFTFETTVAISRLILSGILDECPKLQLLLAHSGGTLPFLCGRLNSCYQNEDEGNYAARQPLKKLPMDYIRDNFLYDSVIYNEHCLQFMLDLVGDHRLLFGTDHPFFPPPPPLPSTPTPTLDNKGNSDNAIDYVPWLSTTENQGIVEHQSSQNIQSKIFRENAINALQLKCLPVSDKKQKK